MKEKIEALEKEQLLQKGRLDLHHGRIKTVEVFQKREEASKKSRSIILTPFEGFHLQLCFVYLLICYRGSQRLRRIQERCCPLYSSPAGRRLASHRIYHGLEQNADSHRNLFVVQHAGQNNGCCEASFWKNVSIFLFFNVIIFL